MKNGGESEGKGLDKFIQRHQHTEPRVVKVDTSLGSMRFEVPALRDLLRGHGNAFAQRSPHSSIHKAFRARFPVQCGRKLTATRHTGDTPTKRHATVRLSREPSLVR